MRYSKQHVYCRACGRRLFIRLAGPGYSETCGPQCQQDLDWRETLSIMGKDYYPQALPDPELDRKD